ncbi:hypothetical protein N0V93_006443 [Gnomoniopsis smithogilvyi]|uniref:TeaA receptor TeaR n=1 Tax=Gnomoniopsis smithogilvyi TaxID=1191159 RepID=A0A9W8YPN1_9PEZI|nr:hypothetical protein N0V93_006443 [Gnomoniopsis smithogilvyi]
MAAMAAAHTATATITPPSSSHGDNNGFQWDFTTAPAKAENYHRQYNDKSSFSKNDTTTDGSYRTPLTAQSGNVAGLDHNSAFAASVNSSGRYALSHRHSNDEDTPDTMADDSLDNDDERQGRIVQDAHKRGKPEDSSDEESKWIHRDKLAKIESEELQAAGITLPSSRSRSRPRRDRSQSITRHGADGSRRRKDSSITLEPKTPDATAAINGYAHEADDDQPARPTTGSRIPVPKKSPGLPRTRDSSPEEFDKKAEASKARSRSNSTTLKSLDPSPTLKSQPKRAGTDISPKKSTTPSGARKTSAPAKTIPPEARGKPKPKNKTTNGSSSGTRPSTRDGLRDSSTGSLGPKQMEGDPPWMINAYKPDPRLPPDQQLLPTVARRLAQERFEQEGKFGTVYDKEFRPLTDEGFLQPPPGASSSGDNIVDQVVEVNSDEWPLKSPEPRSPASVGRSSTYSTMPKIQDKMPSQQSPLPSPRPPQNPITPPTQPPEQLEITRVPDVEKAEDVKGKTGKKKEGCGCCIVM